MGKEGVGVVEQARGQRPGRVISPDPTIGKERGEEGDGGRDEAVADSKTC